MTHYLVAVYDPDDYDRSLENEAMERDIDALATGYSCVHGGDNLADLALQNRPLLIAEYNESQLCAREILLAADVLVGGEQNIKASFFGGGDQFAV